MNRFIQSVFMATLLLSLLIPGLSCTETIPVTPLPTPTPTATPPPTPTPTPTPTPMPTPTPKPKITVVTPKPTPKPVPPETPTLLSPADGSSQPGASVNFEWSAPSGATHYLFEINTDPNWNPETRFGYGDVPKNRLIVAGLPNNGTVYYWRVSAGNSYGWSSPTSGCRLVNVASTPTTAPTLSSPSNIAITTAPTLVSPDQGGTVMGFPVTFTWNPVEGATKYRLRATRPDDSTVVDVVVYGITSCTPSNLKWHLTPFTYHWMVWAGNDAGWCSDAAAYANECYFLHLYIK